MPETKPSLSSWESLLKTKEIQFPSIHKRHFTTFQPCFKLYENVGFCMLLFNSSPGIISIVNTQQKGEEKRQWRRQKQEEISKMICGMQNM